MSEAGAETFRRLLAKDPENPMVLYSLGSQLFKAGEYEEAAAHLGKAVENMPSYSVAHRMLGRSLMELGRHDEARRAFEQGREVAQGNGDLQIVKEIDVFLRRLDRKDAGDP